MQDSARPFAAGSSTAFSPGGGDGSTWCSPVPPECASATLRIGGRTLQAELQDVSVNGITITIKPAHIERLRLGVSWELTTSMERCEVMAQWIYCASPEECLVGVRRLHELAMPRQGGSPRLRVPRIRRAWLLIGLLISLAYVSNAGNSPDITSWMETLLRDYMPKERRR